jgi:hypothetical protein
MSAMTTKTSFETFIVILLIIEIETANGKPRLCGNDSLAPPFNSIYLNELSPYQHPGDNLKMLPVFESMPLKPIV